MTYTVKIGLSAQEHDAFIRTSPLPNLLQSSNWAKIKSSWQHETLGFFENEKLVVSALILIRPLPLGFSMLYIPRGLVMDYGNQALVHFVMTALKKFGRSKKALFITFDPAFLESKSQPLIERLAQEGVRYGGRSAAMHDTIQARFNAMIYQEDFKEEVLDKKTRQFLRKARHSYPQVYFGGVELVDKFALLMKKTEDRKQVSLRHADYYKKLLTTYGEEAFITLVEFDMAALKAEAELTVKKTEENLAKIKNEKRLKVLHEELSTAEQNLSALTEIVAKHGQVVSVAATLTVSAFGAAETLYAGMDTDFQKYYPSYLAWYETIVHAFDRGAKTLNMGGIENSLSETDGLLKFKKHFNPCIEEYVGEFDIPIYPFIYPLAKGLYKLRKTGF